MFLLSVRGDKIVNIYIYIQHTLQFSKSTI